MKYLVPFLVTFSLSIAAASPEVEFLYQDPGGNKWTNVLPGTYSNGCDEITRQCSSPDVIDESSSAFRACQDLGLMLPSRQHWQALMLGFDHLQHSAGLALTKKGIQDFKKLFNIPSESSRLRTRRQLFASTTAIQDVFVDKEAYVFDTSWANEGEWIKPALDGGIIDPKWYSSEPRKNHISVICILPLGS